LHLLDHFLPEWFLIVSVDGSRLPFLGFTASTLIGALIAVILVGLIGLSPILAPVL
jgi:hypothetical protein